MGKLQKGFQDRRPWICIQIKYYHICIVITKLGIYNGVPVRIITRGTLREFWEKYPDAEQELKYWHDKIKNASYASPNEVIPENPKSDIVGNNRIVFNICHNKYRLIVLFRYNLQWAFIRFLGTHKEYDQINDIKNI